MQRLFDAIRESINNIKFGVQSKPDHSAKRLGSDGEIVQQLQGLKIMTERDKVKKLIAEQIAKGMFAVKNKSEKQWWKAIHFVAWAKRHGQTYFCCQSFFVPTFVLACFGAYYQLRKKTEIAIQVGITRLRIAAYNDIV